MISRLRVHISRLRIIIYPSSKGVHELHEHCIQGTLIHTIHPTSNAAGIPPTARLLRERIHQPQFKRHVHASRTTSPVRVRGHRRRVLLVAHGRRRARGLGARERCGRVHRVAHERCCRGVLEVHRVHGAHDVAYARRRELRLPVKREQNPVSVGPARARERKETRTSPCAARRRRAP